MFIIYYSSFGRYTNVGKGEIKNKKLKLEGKGEEIFYAVMI